MRLGCLVGSGSQVRVGGGAAGAAHDLGGGWELAGGRRGVAYEGEGRGVWPTNIEVAQRPSVKRGRSALPAQWPCARSPASDPPLPRPSSSISHPFPMSSPCEHPREGAATRRSPFAGAYLSHCILVS